MVVPAQAQAALSLGMDLGHGRTLTQSINRRPAPRALALGFPMAAVAALLLTLAARGLAGSPRRIWPGSVR